MATQHDDTLTQHKEEEDAKIAQNGSLDVLPVSYLREEEARLRVELQSAQQQVAKWQQQINALTGALQITQHLINVATEAGVLNDGNSS